MENIDNIIADWRHQQEVKVKKDMQLWRVGWVVLWVAIIMAVVSTVVPPVVSAASEEFQSFSTRLSNAISNTK